MAILNKRNAFVGWIVVKAGKIVVKQKAAGASAKARIGAVAAGTLAAVGGVLLIRRHHRHDDGGE